jgi:hypothetical protein
MLFFGPDIWTVALSGSARLSSSNTASKAPDSIDIVDPVRFLFEKVLIQVSAQRGGSECLMAVRAFFIFDRCWSGFCAGLMTAIIACRRVCRTF